MHTRIDGKSSAALLLCGASLLACGVSAHAQSLPQTATDAEATAAASAGGPSNAEIVVTGSRIATNGNQAPTPVTTVTSQQLLNVTPTTVSDGLKQLPAFSLSTGVRTLGNSGSNATGSFLNLRGLGASRTLTLLDGRRVAGASAGGGVDTNTLPQMLLKRVDVVTGGASAVYGTDAVAGVVNFVLDHDFNGIKTISQAGVSNYGDAANYRLGIAAGMPLFGGTGHIEASYDHYRSNGIGSQLDRPLGAKGYDRLVLPDGSRTLFANSRNVISGFPAGGYGGFVVTGPFAGQQFGPGGALIAFNHGVQPNPALGIEVGGDGSWGYTRSITADLDYDQGFLRYDQDLGAIKAFAQGGVSRVYNRNNFFPMFYAFNSIAADNGFLTEAQRQTLANAGVSSFLINKAVVSVEPQKTVSKTDTISATLGLEGTLVGDLKWSAFYSYGRNKSRTTNVGNVHTARRAAALDSVIDPASGQVVCRVTLTNPGLYPGCTPLNPFGPGSESEAAVDYIRDDTFFVLTNTMHNWGGTISGTLFENWAGPVKAALTGEIRKIRASNRSSAQPTTLADCTGLALNCRGPAYASDVTADFRASQTIKEGSLEVALPLLSDMAFARSLSMTGSVRFANYSTSGDVTTWKLGGEWAPVDGLRFRLTRSRDIRAPTLIDLFGPQSLRPAFLNDLHTGASGNISVSSAGNPTVKPEVANTLTFGAVLAPTAIPRFSVAVDYYKISLKQGISNLSGLLPSVQNQCEASNGTSPLCDLFVRPGPFSDKSAANFPSLVREGPVNLASQEYEGIDLELNYGFGIDKIGEFTLRALGTYQIKATNKTFPNDPYQELAGVAAAAAAGGIGGLPRVRANFIASYSTGPFTFNWQTRWRSSLKQQPDVRPEFVTTDPKVPSAAFTNIGVTFDVEAGPARKMQFFANVQNLFNKQPSPYPSSFVGLTGFFYPSYPDDDVVGRAYTAGVRLNF